MVAKWTFIRKRWGLDSADIRDIDQSSPLAWVVELQQTYDISGTHDPVNHEFFITIP